MLPRDFVLEQLPNPLHYGDFPEPTLRCGGMDEWQVGTRLFEGRKRYYRVRWRAPFDFSIVDTKDAPYADCTTPDDRADRYPDLLHMHF